MTLKLYENYTSGDTDYSSCYGSNWFGQVFTIGTTSTNQDFYLSHIRLKLGKGVGLGAGTIGTCYFYIREATTIPSVTNNLSYGTIDGSGLTTDEACEWVDIPMSKVLLRKNQTYAIIINDPTGGEKEYLRIRGDNSAPIEYGGGTRVYSTNNNVSWTAGAGVDFVFEVWGEPKLSGVKIEDIKKPVVIVPKPEPYSIKILPKVT